MGVFHDLRRPASCCSAVPRSAVVAGVLVVVATAGALLVTFDRPGSTTPSVASPAGEPATVPPATVLAEAVPAPTTTVPTAPPPVGRVARSVLILGDSGTVDAAPALTAAYVAAGGTEVVSGAVPGFGLTRPGIDWRRDWAERVERQRPDLVVVIMGGWDTDAVELGGDDAYAAIVDEAVSILTSTGARVLWTSPLPGGNDPRRPADRVYARLPDRYPGSVAHLDPATSLQAPADARSTDAPPAAPAWPRSYVDATGATVVLRKPDSWHLCPEGAERVADAVERATAARGWSTVAPERWQEGPWRRSPHYDDPSGGCVL